MPFRLVSLLLLLWLAVAGSAAMAADPPRRIDVFVSGTDGYHTYRIPALVVSKRETLLAFCEGRKSGRGDHGDLDLVLRRSTDGGRSWLPMQLVYEEGGTKPITIGNPCPVVDEATGTIWLPFCRDNNDVLVTSSKDDGRTWTAPRDITRDVKRPDWTWYATGPAGAIQLTRGMHKGRLVVPCDHRVRDAGSRSRSTRSHVIYSDDHGQSWKLGGITDWSLNECAVAELADGRLLLNMRSNRGKNRRAVAVSQDGGQSWGDVRDDPVLIEPVCQASMIRYSWPVSGDRSRLMFSNPASTGRDHLTVRISYDEGRTWPVSKLLDEGSAAYSCLARLPDGNLGILYERDDYGKIAFSRFPLTWLNDGEEPTEHE